MTPIVMTEGQTLYAKRMSHFFLVNVLRTSNRVPVMTVSVFGVFAVAIICKEQICEKGLVNSDTKLLKF